MAKKRNLLIIYTGGTIGMIKKTGTDTLYPFNFDSTIEHIPEIKQLEINIQVISFNPPLDSTDIALKEWQKLASIIQKNYLSYDGFLILHGTDTMSYTASALSFMVQGVKKPIIFTGSQLPIGDIRTDAKENLISSIYYATLYENNEPVIKEVCIYFEYKLYRANRTTKISAENFQAFDSPTYPALAESGIELYVNKNNLWHTNLKQITIHTHFITEVLLIKVYPNLPILYYIPIIQENKIKAIVLEIFGTGNIPDTPQWNFFIEEVQKKEIIIAIITQCVKGKVQIGKYKNSIIFKKYNALIGYDMTTEAAITKLMYLLSYAKDKETIKQLFETNLVGELSKH